MSLTSIVFLLLATNVVYTLNCYDTDMESKRCHPMQLWCVKWKNDTTVSRGCADVNVCPDEDDGCFPAHAENAAVRWCCCNNDLCNYSQRPQVIGLIAFVMCILNFTCIPL